MNYYHYIFRLNNDPKDSKRSFEGYFPDDESALEALANYVAQVLSQDLFANVIILRKSCYLSVFK